MKKVFLLVNLFILTEITGFSQTPSGKINIYDSIINMKPLGVKKLTPEYESFIRKLSLSVLNKDTSLLLSLVDDNVEIAAGGGIYGKLNFLNEFLRNSEANAWILLSNVLRMGGIIEKDGHIIFPFQRSTLYYHYIKDIDTISCSPYCIYFGIESNVCLYKSPSEKSKILVDLQYPILVSYDEDTYSNEKFLFVRTYDCKYRGWIQKSKIYCDAGRIIRIEKVKNKLKISSVTPFD